MPSRIRAVRDLFDKALEAGPTVLDDQEPSLRLEVLELIDSYRSWSAALEPVLQPELVLPQFGPYRCDGLLGAGGMGTVYRAHRNDGQFEQQVAIKVLRTSLRTEWYLRRFLAEREILARLSHRHIARMFDGGTTGAGEPYLVMELVEGEPIHEYVVNHKWSIRERVESICQAAEAIEYAHRNLVVHRDIKPGNVMINSQREVKLLDFGTSKLTGDDATLTSNVALTPGYASPEQLRGEAVTTATDIYSLSLVAFTTITGQPPYPGGLLAIQRANEDQPLPQHAVLPTDLWNVLSKAAAFDSARRYTSAGDFAADLRRFLEGKPVLARPLTLTYRLTRFVQRRPWAVTAAIAAAAVIVYLSILAAIGTRNVRRELEINERTISFTQSLFAQGAASSMMGKSNLQYGQRTVAQAIADASDRMKNEALPPAVEIRLRYWIATLQVSVNDYSHLKDHMDRVRMLASSDRERAIADHLSGLEQIGKLDFAAAERFYRNALRFLDAHPEETLPDRALVHGNLGAASFLQAKLDNAAPMFRACRNESAARYGTSHTYYLRCTIYEIELLRRQSKIDEAIQAINNFIGGQNAADPPLELGEAYALLALTLAGKGNGEGEVDAWRKSVEIARRYSRPEDHECLPVYRNYLFAALKRNKDLSAIAAIEGIAKHCPTEALGTLELKMGLTEAYKHAGRWSDAEASAREAVRVANTHSKRGLGYICWAEQSLAILLIDRRKNLDEAKSLLEASRAEYLTVYGPTNNVSAQRLTKRLDDLAKLRAGK